MDELRPLIDAVIANPTMAVGVAIGAGALFLLLHRKPRIQRDADARLAALRREKADQYTKPRY